MKNVDCLDSALLVAAVLLLPSIAMAGDKPAAPYVNPFLADSHWPSSHFVADYTPLAGPEVPSHRLNSDEWKWQPVGPINSWPQIYSGPYPNGKRVIWVGGYDRIQKLDADTLQVLTTHAIGGNTYYGDEEVRRLITEFDRDDDKAQNDWVKFWMEPFPSAVSIYRVLTKEGELFIPHRATDGSFSLRVYSDDGVDPASKIQFRREWKIPPEVSRASIFGMMLTSDGHIVMTTQDGVLIALSRDFSTYDTVKLPRTSSAGETRDLMSSFVRNSISVDEQGGVYVVTRENLHRVQWTGRKLSLDEADGAWSAPYPDGLGTGSGTTPALMGWGPKEDHLVLIANSNPNNELMAFWRDQIPADWKGLPGYDRRVVGVVPVNFGLSKDEKNRIENALVIRGYGAFTNDTYPLNSVYQGSPTKQWLTDSFRLHEPGHEALGGIKVVWDPQARVLRKAWSSTANFGSVICTISGAKDMLYCWGGRNGEWTLEGVDWNTGASKVHYILGKSQRFNPFGGWIIVNPNGGVDCACTGGMGVVRVTPKQIAKQGAGHKLKPAVN